MDTFCFAIDLPDAPDLHELFAVVAAQMSRYIGLDEVEASQAGDVLSRLVTDRLTRTGERVRVAFKRPHTASPVSVEITGRALPDDVTTASPGGGVVIETDGRVSRLCLSWIPRADG